MNCIFTYLTVQQRCTASVYYQKGQYCREPVFLGGWGRRRRRRRRETASPFLSEDAAAKQETLTSVGKWEQAPPKILVSSNKIIKPPLQRWEKKKGYYGKSIGCVFFLLGGGRREGGRLVKYLTLRSVSSVNNPRNNEMKICENMKLTC